jgi:hypothetical protein
VLELWQEGSQEVQLSQTVEEGKRGETEKEERLQKKGEASSKT